jgi:MoaA/NifB/PqqE/SkfB family radical SAM enzyme
MPMLAKLAYRAATELSPRLAAKAAHLWVYKGMLAVRSYQARISRKELYPPFMFVALTNTCNLRCHGCWVEKEGEAFHMQADELDNIIRSGKRRNAFYYTLLGGEPFMHKGIWDIFKRHPDCYFQAITNGMLFTERNADRIAEVGNVTPLISIDGLQLNNDMRRGEGVHESALTGMERLKKRGVIFGTACTITKQNLNEVLCDSYLEDMIKRGCMYIWYYFYRPVGEEPHPEYCLTQDDLVEARRRMVALRHKHPIIIIDTYWTADGEAFCPAAMGMGFHIGPRGSIEICPPLSFATDTVRDNGGDLVKTISKSSYLKGFKDFVSCRTKGCVILEHPQELHDYIKSHGAKDYSTRDAFAELNSIKPRHSQHLPGREIPESSLFYWFLKKNVFFGMGAM